MHAAVTVLLGKSYWGGRLSTVVLFVLTSLAQLIFILKILFSFFTKQATLVRRSTVLCLPPQLVFPGAALAVATLGNSKPNTAKRAWTIWTNTSLQIRTNAFRLVHNLKITQWWDIFVFSTRLNSPTSKESN